MPVVTGPLYLTSHCPDDSTLIHCPLNESESIPDYKSLLSVCSRGGQSSVKIQEKNHKNPGSCYLPFFLILRHGFRVSVSPRGSPLKSKCDLLFSILHTAYFALNFTNLFRKYITHISPECRVRLVSVYLETVVSWLYSSA